MLEHSVVHLPPQFTSFVGRADEIIHIAQQLSKPDCRLLTLVGPGGIGKTRLAIEIASKKSNEFPDGVYFVDLQPVSAVDSLVTTIANSIDIRFFGEQPPRVQLLNFLSDRNLLLLIDNFEHSLVDVDLLTEIVKTASKVKMLVTSREALNVQEEWLWQVQGLQFPENTHTESIENFSAVCLFVERARRVRADFSLDNQGNQVIRICRLIEGMPLALELAASWTKALSCGEIADEIQSGIDFLKTSVRNVPERHRSMQAVFDQSWQMLTDVEQDVFPKLSVFRGGFGREAAEAVAGASLQTLAGLINKSFLRLTDAGRYELQELVRQYSEEKLAIMPGEPKTTQDRHCAYFVDFLHEREVKLKGAEQVAALNQIQAELDNILVAWNTLIEQTNEGHLNLSWHSLFLFFHIRSKMVEGERAFEQAVKHFEQTDNELLGCLILAQNWFNCNNRGGDDRDSKSIQKGFGLLREFGTPEDAVVPLMILCIGKRSEEFDLKITWQFYEENLGVFRSQGKWWGAGWILYGLGQITYQIQEFDESEAYYRESIKIFREMGSYWALSFALGGLAVVFNNSKRYDQLQPLLQEHQSICQEIGDTNGVLWSLNCQGYNALRQKDIETARHCFIQGLKAALGSDAHVHVLHDTLGGFLNPLVDKGKIDTAVELIGFLLKNAYKVQAYTTAEEITRNLDKFSTQLPSDVFQRALERGKTLDLKTIGLQLLEEFSISEKQPDTTLAPSANQYLPDPLTERELEVLRLVADGLHNQEIADQLFVALGTVKAHINAIYRKLDVANRVQGVTRARRLKLL